VWYIFRNVIGDVYDVVDDVDISYVVDSSDDVGDADVTVTVTDVVDASVV